MKIALCLNCLERGEIREVPVGGEKGSQMDPHRDTLGLCAECEHALLNGDFAKLAERHVSERMIRREEDEPFGPAAEIARG